MLFRIWKLQLYAIQLGLEGCDNLQILSRLFLIIIGVGWVPTKNFDIHMKDVLFSEFRVVHIYYQNL